MLQTTLLGAVSAATTQQDGSAVQIRSVILGAIIGVVGSLLVQVVSQIFSYLRWRMEKKLALAEEELRERKEVYPKIIGALSKVAEAGEWPMGFVSELVRCAPWEAVEKASGLVSPDKSVDEKSKVCWEIVDCLTADLLKRREERRAIVFGRQLNKRLLSIVAGKKKPTASPNDSEGSTGFSPGQN